MIKDIVMMAGGTGSGERLLAVSHAISPFITIYEQDGDDFNNLPPPTSLPPDNGNAVAFSADGVYMAVAHSNAPRISIYKRGDDGFVKLPNPATLPPSIGRGVSFSPDGQILSVAHDASPFVTIYKRSGDTFTKLPNPSTLPTGAGYGVAFGGNVYMVVVHIQSPFITVYKRSGDTFTKLDNPAVLPVARCIDVAFSADGTHMVVVGLRVAPTYTSVYVYRRDGDTFTSLAFPDSISPTATSNGVGISSDGTYFVVGNDSDDNAIVYKRVGSSISKLAAFQFGAVRGYKADFSADDEYMAVGHTSVSPFVAIFKRDGDTFSRLPGPAVPPTGAGLGIAFYPRAR